MHAISHFACDSYFRRAAILKVSVILEVSIEKKYIGKVMRPKLASLDVISIEREAAKSLKIDFGLS